MQDALTQRHVHLHPNGDKPLDPRAIQATSAHELQVSTASMRTWRHGSHFRTAEKNRFGPFGGVLGSAARGCGTLGKRAAARHAPHASQWVAATDSNQPSGGTKRRADPAFRTANFPTPRKSRKLAMWCDRRSMPSRSSSKSGTPIGNRLA